MSGTIFWGSILLLIGLVMIVNVIFKMDLPVMRILLAAILIFIGVKLLLGKHVRVFNHESHEYHYSSFNADNKSQQEYNVVFSKGHVDLRNVTFDKDQPLQVEIHTVFGTTDLYLNKQTPCRIMANTAFATVNIPNGNNVVVGTSSYQSDSLDTSKPFLDIKMDVVFGSTKVIFY